MMMDQLDSMRNNLYDEFKPKINLLNEINIQESGFVETSLYPAVATKKVTQIRHMYTPKTEEPSQVDNQPEILQEVESDSKKFGADLPPTGPLMKPIPEVDSTVYIMKNPLSPWIKAKVGKNDFKFLDSFWLIHSYFMHHFFRLSIL